MLDFKESDGMGYLVRFGVSLKVALIRIMDGSHARCGKKKKKKERMTSDFFCLGSWPKGGIAIYNRGCSGEWIKGEGSIKSSNFSTFCSHIMPVPPRREMDTSLNLKVRSGYKFK